MDDSFPSSSEEEPLPLPYTNGHAVPEANDPLDDAEDISQFLLPPEVEDELLAQFDAAHNLLSPPPEAFPHGHLPPTSTFPTIQPSRQQTMKEREKERDRDLAIRNPVSVYNWLKRNQSKILVHDHEAGPPDRESALAHPAGETPNSAPTGGAKQKRGSVKKSAPSRLGELHQQDDAESAFGSSTRGDAPNSTSKKRRKTNDEDGPYKGKVAGAGKGGKRKRDDGDTPSGVKKPRKLAARE